MNEVKRIPYGIANFKELRRQNMYYVDKTMYIPKLEYSGNFLFLIRPRRFGKSIFLSMVRSYYDMLEQERFDELFDGLYIHEHPTEERGKYQVIYFDFSLATSGLGTLEERFHTYCSQVLIDFADRYKEFYDDDFYDSLRACGTNSSEQLIYIRLKSLKKGYNLYLIVDEYDNFTNSLLSEQGQEAYHSLTHAAGFYRDVFKIYKESFSRILMMGVSPVTMDDLSSGYNISRNISMHPFYNMMLGFSETDVREMIDYYREAGQISASADALIAEMKPWYDNYCFSKQSFGKDPKMFNCDMVLYYLMNYIDMGEAPEEMIDPNTRTDYAKLKKLIELDHITAQEKGVIHEIAVEGRIKAQINTSFPAHRIFEPSNFVSLLYYYGMLTIGDVDDERLMLIIPNNNVRKQYYEYILEDYQSDAHVDMNRLSDAMSEMARRGNWRPALQMIAEKYKELSSVRSAIQGERHVQGFFTAYLNFTKYYLTAPEVELNHGYCDFFLMPDRVRYKNVLHSYIVELKYLPSSASEGDAARQWDEAVAQIKGYAAGERVGWLCKDTELHLVVVQMKDYETLRIEEI